MSGPPSPAGASGARRAADGAAPAYRGSLRRDLWASAGWALSAVVWGLGLSAGIMLLLAVAVGVGGGGREQFLQGVGATMYLLPFAVVVALVIVLPVTLLLLSTWVLLARRGRIDDGARAGLGVSAAITGLIAALVFAVTSGAIDEPFALSTIILVTGIATVVCAALLLPRYTVLGLEPGRFGPPA